MTMAGDEIEFDWDSLVPRFVHPVKVAIIEAMRWVGEPLSASELARIFERRDLSTIAYHLNKLVEVGVFEQVDERQVRGALQRFYLFTGAP
jgi:DNA-binding transcriptional ArsR family regulator